MSGRLRAAYTASCSFQKFERTLDGVAKIIFEPLRVFKVIPDILVPAAEHIQNRKNVPIVWHQHFSSTRYNTDELLHNLAYRQHHPRIPCVEGNYEYVLGWLVANESGHGKDFIYFSTAESIGG